MLEFLKITDDNDALTILKKDHDKVKGLFDDFENAGTLARKKKIVADTIMELKLHATIEEEIFYPSLRTKGVDKALLNEADEEHHVAKLLIAELEQMDGKEEHYIAKYTVLSENIKHHIKEEEDDLFPQARKTKIDFVALGKRLLTRKQQLMRNGVPLCAEEKMIAAHKKGSGDSPARTAAKKQPSKTAIKAPNKKTAATKAKVLSHFAKSGKPAARHKAKASS